MSNPVANEQAHFVELSLIFLEFNMTVEAW